MIPKIIHYCWFGGNPKPSDVEKYIATWRRYCPDYEIKEWNESNFDVHMNRYCSEAYDNKKWAFVSDVARVYALYNEGGIYMDTDVEVVKSLDPLLQDGAFLGFEGKEWIATNIMGTEAKNPFFKKFLDSYETRSFVREDGSFDETTNVGEMTRLLTEEYGLQKTGLGQKIAHFIVYPSDFFSPYDYINGTLKKTPNTYTIHWFSQSWIKRSKLKTRLSQLYHRIFKVKME